jgi:FtsP/CotA-like multicopper oxidase with cupredoxin domain
MFRDNLRRAFVISTLFLILAALITTSADGQSLPQFPQPKVRRSLGGVLNVPLHTIIAPNLIQDPTTGETRLIETPTYNGTIPGPTLRVKPGDSLQILLINEFPPNPAEQRMGDFPHDPYTTNLHTHGWTVSPEGISDNVLRKMEPGTTNDMRVELPRDHQSGTFWYHPHKHGSVSFQFFGGMAGFLIVDGGPGTLDAVPEVKAAKEVLMAFQEIRTDKNGQLPFVNPAATHLGTDLNNPQPGGLWSTLQDSNFYFTTNGVTNPILQMRPGEVQRWRLLNAAQGATFLVALQAHSLNIIANDGITVPDMQTLAPGQPYVLGTGQRADVLVKAGRPGTYFLQALDPADPRGWSVVSASGIDPAPRNARFSADFPGPTFPLTLATIVVSGIPRHMRLPGGHLPVPKGLPSIETMLNTPPNAVRKVAFEICGQRAFMTGLGSRLPTCGWYFNEYDAGFWGATEFTTLTMMRDDDDKGKPSPDPAEPLWDFQKEGLFTEDKPLFDDMIVGNFEEWTVVNRSFSDHTFHIHQNPFLLTHVNGKPLPVPEWHDTIIVPAAQPQPGSGQPVNINNAMFGSITFRTHFEPNTVGSFVMHCHILVHEDIGMMQRLEILPREAGGSTHDAASPNVTGRSMGGARHSGGHR